MFKALYIGVCAEIRLMAVVARTSTHRLEREDKNGYEQRESCAPRGGNEHKDLQLQNGLNSHEVL
jgi:hypothetical protein